ncbi:MAG: rhomboid family intramembrane serine protease [Candidatus Methanoperedens sp.]|nr:rhomboid family intramembrane serine protease [Candidatus Methanoperedens sp.]
MKLTNLLILLCTTFTLYAWNTPDNLAFSGYALFHGGYYTLLTGLFVHANIVHLAGNMLFLYIFGNILENEVGALRVASVFFTSGVLSFILSIPFYPNANMVGASAAIFAVMAAVLLVRRPGYSIQFLSPVGPLALLYFIFNIADIGSGGNVAYISHVFGFVIGLFFGARWNIEWKKSLLFTLLLLAVYIVLYNYLKTWI